MFFAQILRRLYNISHLACGTLFIIDAPVGKAPETAVRIHKYLLGPVVLKSSFRVANNRLNAFSLIRARIDNTEPYFAIGEHLPHHIDVPRPRSGIFQDELPDSYFVKAWDERLVIPSKQHLLRAAPVATAYVETCTRALHSLDNPVQKLCRILQFRTRITAGC
jgi:hypothetical protein